MQKMMQQAEVMQRCFANVDQAAMEQLGNRADAMGEELRELCQSGRRDEAMQKAVAFVEEMKASEDVQTMHKCGEMAQQMMPSMPMNHDLEDFLDLDTHVCEQL